MAALDALAAGAEGFTVSGGAEGVAPPPLFASESARGIGVVAPPAYGGGGYDGGGYDGGGYDGGGYDGGGASDPFQSFAAPQASVVPCASGRARACACACAARHPLRRPLRARACAHARARAAAGVAGYGAASGTALVTPFGEQQRRARAGPRSRYVDTFNDSSRRRRRRR